MAGNYGADKEFVKIFRKLEAQGWTVRATRSGHWSCYSPDGKSIVGCGSTNSDVRAIRNFRSELRRAGADV